MADVPTTPQQAQWLVAVGGLAGSVGTVLLQLLIGWFRERRKLQKQTVVESRESRKDAISEWRALVDRKDKEIVRVGEQFELRLDRLSARTDDCEKDRSELRVTVESLKGTIRLHESTIKRLQTLTNDEPPAAGPALIIADLTGEIRRVTPHIQPLLHWNPQELLGKNIEMMIPERLREQHRAGLKRVAELSSPPWPERTILTEALTKDGVEVPVSITLYGWRESDSEWLISANIQRRYTITRAAKRKSPHAKESP